MEPTAVSLKNILFFNIFFLFRVKFRCRRLRKTSRHMLFDPLTGMLICSFHVYSYLQCQHPNRTITFYFRGWEKHPSANRISDGSLFHTHHSRYPTQLTSAKPFLTTGKNPGPVETFPHFLSSICNTHPLPPATAKCALFLVCTSVSYLWKPPRSGTLTLSGNPQISVIQYSMQCIHVGRFFLHHIFFLTSVKKFEQNRGFPKF